MERERKRSVINAFKLVNDLRALKGLPKAVRKPKRLKLTPAVKTAIMDIIVRQQFQHLLDQEVIMSEDDTKKVGKAFEQAAREYQEGRFTLDQVVVNTPISVGAETPKAKAADKKPAPAKKAQAKKPVTK